MRNVLIQTIIICAVLLSGGCAKSSRPIMMNIGSMNTTEHHIRVGWQMLKVKDGQNALQVFDNALALSPESSEAMTGKSLALTMIGREEEAFESASSAVLLAQTPTEVGGANVAKMKALTVFRPDDWLDRTRGCYKSVIDSLEENPEATLLMANALAAASQYDEAATLYAGAVNLGGDTGKDASESWKTMQRERRLMASQRAARGMASKEAVTRAEFSAILVEGLYLHQIIATMKNSAPISEFVTPKQMDAMKKASLSVPVDVRGHALVADIMAIMTLRLRGLEPLPDGRFHPDEPLTRAETAMVLQDLAGILEFWNVGSVAAGQDSFFSDVPSGHYALSAIVFCVSHSLMVPREKGQFGSAEALSGLEAIECIEGIRNIMDIPREKVVKGEKLQGMSGNWKVKLIMGVLKSGIMMLI